jgi:hypothetical protein
MKTELTVIKSNHLGREVIRYLGELLERKGNQIGVQARFGLENVKLVDIPLEVGDLFLETYYSDHWYNIFEIHAKRDNKLKGWYCNVSYPAEIGDNTVTFRDLALDLLVYPDGRQVVLDEDEFAALDISEQDKVMALAGLAELRRIFREKFAK